MKYFTLIILLISLLYQSCKKPKTINPLNSNMQTEYQYPFQNPTLNINERVDDLISRLSLEEKIKQLLHDTPAIERLGIPEYSWWNECLHGVARNGKATVFPQAIGMAATWDPDLIFKVGDVISTEARAKFNVTSSRNHRARYQGLTFWTPNVNIFRDPRWGRGQETYGEDPFLTSKIGVSFVKGLQGNDTKYLKSAAMAKHYAVHNGPEESRHRFDAKVNMKDLWETYLPAFEALVVEADVEGVMGAYNRLNGIPCCAHPYLIDEILRRKWKFDGYFVSDCWAVQDFHDGHNVVKTPAEAAALALNKGCNLNCGDTYNELDKSIKSGLTSEETINKNLKQLLPTRFRLGLFDPPSVVPFSKIPVDVVRQESHVNLTREVAQKSMILLKNSTNLLPLDKEIGRVFVTGPMATHAQALLANYYGVSDNLVTFLEGIVGKVSAHTLVKYSQGALLDTPNRNPMDWYSEHATESDVTIACIGISQLIEGEEGESIASSYKGDRIDMKLPQNQIDFIKKMRKASKKLVVVVTGGSAINLKEIYELADAIVYAWYPGEQGGNALADLLFGDVSPSGKLPITIPYSIEDLPPFEDYSMKGRTYKYMTKEPMFPFGFGLNYGKITYSNIKVDTPKVTKGSSIKVNITISNESETPTDEVIQVYLKDKTSAITTLPVISLVHFKRIYMGANAKENLVFEITPKMMELVDNEGKRQLEAGEFEIMIGGSAPTERSITLGSSPHAVTSFEIY